MIKSLIATTREIDDAAAAVAEILGALDIENQLLNNSLGIISCFPEFEETGVLKAICDALPFECIGATTNLCAANNEVDQILLAITVLTSDDCAFHTSVIPIEDGYAQTIDTSIQALLSQSTEKPELLLSFFPLINEISGDMLLSALDRATGGTPLFGTMAVDHTLEYSTAMTIHNGVAYRRAVVLGGICGKVSYTFEIASLDESKIRRQKAIITESNGNLLIGVNGKTALEYLCEIGLTQSDLASGSGILPLVVDHKDGTKPVARAVFALTPEGYAVCGGVMPTNTTLGIGQIDAGDVLHTSASAFTPLLRDDAVVLSYSCIARYLVLGANSSDEADKIAGLAGDVKYMFAYSGGEICPLPDSHGNLKNYFHNYTIAFCRLS